MIKATWKKRLAPRPIPEAKNATEQRIVNELAEIGDRDELLRNEQEAIRARRAVLLDQLDWPSRALAPVCRISHTTIAAIRQKTLDAK